MNREIEHLKIGNAANNTFSTSFIQRADMHPGEFNVGKRIISLAETSLCCALTNKTSLRKLTVSIVERPVFDSFIMVCIMLNSLCMAMFDYEAENKCDYVYREEGQCPYEGRSHWNYAINIAGDVFGLIFTIEAILKIISYGFVFDKKAYLRS